MKHIFDDDAHRRIGRIAPPDPLPEFYIEAGYLRDIVIRWETHEMRNDDEGILFLMEWAIHRRALARVSKRDDPLDNVRACIAFTDKLIRDWLRRMHQNPPLEPLDSARLSAFREHIRKVEAIKSEQRIFY